MVNSYTEDQLIHSFLDILYQCEKYSDKIPSRQAPLRREEKSIDQKPLSISDLQTHYLNSENSVRNIERSNFDQLMCSHCEGSHPTEKCFRQQQNGKLYKKPLFNPRKYNNKRNKCNSWKPDTCFKCGLQDHFIANFPKPDT